MVMRHLSAKNGYKSFNILESTDCLVQITEPYYSTSLTSRHENCPCNPLTSSHGLYCYISNLPLLTILVAAIAIVSYNHDSPYQVPVLITLSRMLAGEATKRTREGAAITATSSTTNSLHIPWNKAYQHMLPAASGSSSRTTNNKVLVNPQVIHPREKARLAEELRETRYGDKACEMCSSASRAVRHHHFSSTAIRRMVMSDRRSDTAMCPVCKIPEPVTIPALETRRVVMADSSLLGLSAK